MKQVFCLTVIFIFVATDNARAQIGSNGGFVLEQSAIASGGGESLGAGFSVYGTAGQSIAGTQSTGPARQLHGGFWNGAPLAPTAAHVEIGGRATTADGTPIGKATLVLTDASGMSRLARTNPFGWYRFYDIAAGQTVYVTISAKRFSFAEPTRVFHVVDNFDELNFFALETY